MKQEKHRNFLVVVAQSRYDQGWTTLTGLDESAKDLGRALATGSVMQRAEALTSGGQRAAVLAELQDFSNGLEDGDRVILVWAGHGHPEAGHVLVCQDSPQVRLFEDDEITARKLADRLAKSRAEKVLLILDTCYSGHGSSEAAKVVLNVFAERTYVAGEERAFSVIASQLAMDPAYAGVFTNALRRVLTDDDKGLRRTYWGDNDRFITADDLSSAINHYLTDRGHEQQSRPVSIGNGLRFLPNPRFRRGLAPQPVEGWVDEHLEWSARGVEVGQSGWCFVGRTEVLRGLVRWVRAKSGGLVVVTGAPGSGKSAVIGRLVTLAHPDLRRQATAAGVLLNVARGTIPPVGSIDASVYAKGKTAEDVAVAVARALGVNVQVSDQSFGNAVVDAIGHLDGHKVIVIDGVDEAANPRRVAKLCRQLAGLARVSVLVGSRWSPTGRPINATDQHTELREAFGETAEIVDLTRDFDRSPASIGKDIATYAEMRLSAAGSPLAGNQESSTRLAERIAKRASGIFLYARVVTRTFMERPGIGADLPEDVDRAFLADLDRFGSRRRIVEDFYEGLAWAQGGGLTRRVWTPVTCALSGREYTDADLLWVLEHAGWHIIEAGEQGQTVYRLYHQTFTDHYQQACRKRLSEEVIHGRITATLLQTVRDEEALRLRDVGARP